MALAAKLAVSFSSIVRGTSSAPKAMMSSGSVEVGSVEKKKCVTVPQLSVAVGKDSSFAFCLTDGPPAVAFGHSVASFVT